MAASSEKLTGSARRERIIELLAEGSTQVERLSEALGVSLATVRRDLTQLRQESRITRTYGGAVLGSGPEVSVLQRRMRNVRAKDAIARHAATLTGEDEVVLLDAGTTTERLARHLRHIPGLTVFTNGLGAVNTLAEEGVADLVVLGGSLRNINQTMTGPIAEQTVRGLYADVLFLGADAVHPARGIASRTYPQSTLKTLMSQHARRIVVLCDSSKLLVDESSYYSQLTAPWTLVTDDGVDEETLAALHETAGPGVEIVVCPLAAADDDPSS